MLKALAPRWFAMRDLHPDELGLLQSRNTSCWLKGC